MGTTERDETALQPPEMRGREALVVAFPTSRALPVPPSGERVGRPWLATFGVEDTKASREHVAFTRAGGVLRATDLGSRNGTWVDGTQVGQNDSAPLEDGSVLRIGRTVLVYRKELLGAERPDPPLGALVSPFGMRGVRAEIARIVEAGSTTVLIEGETGTGKELVAAALARALGRDKRYVAVNIAAIAAGVFEAQLFGYVAGSFSGGGRGSEGVLVAHDGGAVFLDEIGDLPLDLQPKLLRVLENREVLAVGATRPRRVDVAIFGATNHSLDAMVEAGTFRRDLLARLSARRLELPPLRGRREDIFAIATSHGLSHDQVEAAAVERLLLQPWPANVRELMTTLDRIATHQAPPALPLWAVERVLGPSDSKTLTYEAAHRAVAAASGNESAAARALGVTRARLRRLLAKR